MTAPARRRAEALGYRFGSIHKLDGLFCRLLGHELRTEMGMMAENACRVAVCGRCHCGVIAFDPPIDIPPEWPIRMGVNPLHASSARAKRKAANFATSSESEAT